jgi:hypothetical protein
MSRTGYAKAHEKAINIGQKEDSFRQLTARVLPSSVKCRTIAFMTQLLHLTDPSRDVIATVEIETMTHDFVEGRIIAHQFSDEMLRIFASFQEMIEHEMFGFLDQFEQYVAALNLHVLIEDTPLPVYDLQVIDLKQISFRIANGTEETG